MHARSSLKAWLTGSTLVLALIAMTGLATAGGKKLGNGVACTFNSDCESNNCSFKVCKSRSGSKKALTNGAACTFNSDCESNNCSFKVCKSKSGGKKLGNGIACTFNSDCESNNCSFKVCKKR